MATLNEELSRLLEEELIVLMHDLIEAYDNKGMRASGNWANSLEIQIDGLKGRLLGEKYTEQLEYGRRAGGFPPIAQIEDWIARKGIQPVEADITIKQLAFLIARKIAREGYNRDRYGGVALVSEVITPQRVKEAIERIGGTYAIVTLSYMQEQIKKTFT